MYSKVDIEKNKSFVTMFQEDFLPYNIEIRLVIVEEINDYAKWVAGLLESTQNGEKIIFAINRSRNWLIAKALEINGIRVFNNSKVTKIANNKKENYLFLKGVVTYMDIIEDEENLNRGISLKLKKEGYAVFSAACVSEGLKLFQDNTIDLVICDIGLPDGSGLDLCANIRQRSDVLFLFLTALDTEVDVITGYEMGADDYVTKPFDIKEVTARVEVQIRRAETTGRKEEEHRFTYQELELNKGDFTVKVGNTELPHITKQEFSILELLLKHPKKVFSKEEMFEYAWEEQYMGETKTLDVHISNIRKKIKAVTQEEYIDTVWGIGYRLHS